MYMLNFSDKIDAELREKHVWVHAQADCRAEAQGFLHRGHGQDYQDVQVRYVKCYGSESGSTGSTCFWASRIH
jgi:hypothetical protein